MRIVYTSDLHIESVSSNSNICNNFLVKIQRQKPDFVIFGGDIIEFHQCWSQFLTVLTRRLPNTSCNVLLGNHDFWTFRDDSLKYREDIYDYVWKLCKRFDVNFLEESPILVGSSLLCGTSAWYDYTVKPETVNKEFLIVNKGRFNNDGNYLHSNLTDEQYASLCQKRLIKNIKKFEKETEDIFVFTHVPIFRECVVEAPIHYRKEEWDMSNAYFFNLNLGDKLSKNNKVRLVVSSHIHRYLRGVLKNGIEYVTCGADYHRPEMLVIDINGSNNISVSRLS